MFIRYYVNDKLPLTSRDHVVVITVIRIRIVYRKPSLPEIKTVFSVNQEYSYK